MEQYNKYYKAVSQPPRDALKQIQAGRTKGMTDISPQWRIEAMTKTYGICGIGWKYEVSRKWTEKMDNGEVMAFVDVNLFIKVEDQWSDAIPGHGGSKLATKEKSGIYYTDEGYKMATTDALSVAMKMVGVAADIYRGLFDGSKYNEPQLTRSEQLTMAITEMEQVTSIDALKQMWTKHKQFQQDETFAAAKDKRKGELTDETN